MSGSTREARIPMTDGVELAATLYLPETDDPQPCLLEALPYRKDDLTSSYAEGYLKLRDDHGYAVCRLDVRGTGSSAGDATDEYPAEEQRDLVEVIAWLAAEDWCDGNVGMFGTSYSGFNSLQIACERPPALKAVCAIYSSDDRWTDDVHWRGGALRLVDLVDYCHYMTPMTVLPPVPAVWDHPDGRDWDAEWQRRLDTFEPWVLTWLRENRYGDYWRRGSVRLGPDGSGYDRIACPVMLVAGWADGYRNNSFRTIKALAANGVPHRLLAGPWAHADPTTAMPGPRIDFDREMVAWFDHWLRGAGSHEDGCDVFVRWSTDPEPDLDLSPGRWLRLPSVPPTTATVLPLVGQSIYIGDPDVGTAAWIDCAGHLPWGQSTDQRLDDARSLTFDLDPPRGAIVGHPKVRLRLSIANGTGSLSVKLCSVGKDGTSVLITRGTLDLRYRNGVHGPRTTMEPGRIYEIEVELDACAFEYYANHRLRVSLAHADWPNTVAESHEVDMELIDGELELPILEGDFPTPSFGPGAEHSAESMEGVTWEITNDVLRRITRAITRSTSAYPTPYDGTAREDYRGRVSINRRTHVQRAHADTTYDLTWPGVSLQVHSVMDVTITGSAYAVQIDVRATRDGSEISHRTWTERIDR